MIEYALVSWPLENPAVTKAIAEATARLGHCGRFLVPPSSAEPVIKVRGDADALALGNAFVSSICEAVASVAYGGRHLV